MNRVLEDILRHYVNPSHTDWDEFLSVAEFAVNNAVSASTGFTPFYLNYGKHPNTPVRVIHTAGTPAAEDMVTHLQNCMTLAKSALQRAQSRQKLYADQKRTPLQFAVDDMVFVSSTNVPLALARCTLSGWASFR